MGYDSAVAIEGELKMGAKYPYVERNGIRYYRCCNTSGHLLAYDTKTKRLTGAHVFIWEEHNGPVPKGYVVHHINGDPKDNRIENLTIMTSGDHTRLHAGQMMVGGKWHKRCCVCGFMKCEDEFYHRKAGQGRASMCKVCQSRYCHERYLRKKAEAEALSATVRTKRARNKLRRAT